MNNFTEIMAVVEGPTEKIFIEKLVAPHLASSNIFIQPMIISKSGQNGGDVKFSRAKNDIEKHLKQRSDTFVTLFIDYYGTKNDWPGILLTENEQQALSPTEKAARVNNATLETVIELYPDARADIRFIPFIAMYEFEALLFSEPHTLASKLDLQPEKIQEILTECGSPENINNSPHTSPSKRLDSLTTNRFKKTTTGIAIAQTIGLTGIRSKCPLFDSWLSKLEALNQ